MVQCDTEILMHALGLTDMCIFLGNGMPRKAWDLLEKNESVPSVLIVTLAVFVFASNTVRPEAAKKEK